MKDEHLRENKIYFNEFTIDKESKPKKSKQKLTSLKTEKIKITNKKLPPDFFRPNTHATLNMYPSYNREEALKTPSFGQEKKESYSVTLMPKQKKLSTYCFERIETLPVQSYPSLENDRRSSERQSKTRERSYKEEQFSYREVENKKEKNKQASNRREAHNSYERGKIRYRKKTQLFEEREKHFQKQLALKLNFQRILCSENNQFIPFKKISNSQEKVKSQRLPPIAL